jgi:hypothetical protein
VDQLPAPAPIVAGIRAALAAYTQALDDGRTDDVVATFCPDGGCDIPGLGAHRGHQALRSAYDAVKPRVPQRHLVLNTRLTYWSDAEATAVSDVVFLVRAETGWSVLLVGRYTDTFHDDGGIWRFHHRAAEFVS